MSQTNTSAEYPDQKPANLLPPRLAKLMADISANTTPAAALATLTIFAAGLERDLENAARTARSNFDSLERMRMTILAREGDLTKLEKEIHGYCDSASIPRTDEQYCLVRLASLVDWACCLARGLKHIAEMPVHDQDDWIRVRHAAAATLEAYPVISYDPGNFYWRQQPTKQGVERIVKAQVSAQLVAAVMPPQGATDASKPAGKEF